MELSRFFNIFGIIVLGMILIFLASSGGATGLSNASQGIAKAGGTFFSGFQQAV